ncbi:hypothetical protein TOI97_05620 [Denitrificimonas sp. JX-1]|uniref:Uncharacterized protein n=1 Tax=Denitrificimonas halotolerans TaxID=3098930 RepID=A0ABU5GPY4_9GAMM|nr:hypothetical protein [Denitrificimonas sp. JX-1]MDY7219050.1 hypothetical protein [Denitrificimonas sp. JX-1]
MSSALLEIVELPDGRIVLRRSEEDTALVTLTFSSEAKGFLKASYIDIAKEMFHAGLLAAGHLAEEEASNDLDENDPAGHTLH